MVSVDLKTLVSRLGEDCRRALENSISFALMQTHFYVEIEHWLLKLAENKDADFALIMKYSDIDQGKFSLDLSLALGRLRSGSARGPGFSSNLINLVKQAWLVASLDFGVGHIRSGHLLLVLLSDDDLSRYVFEISTEFRKISVDALRRDYKDATFGSAEQNTSFSVANPEGDIVDGSLPRKKVADALEQYTVNLTEAARSGLIDPIIGRDEEIRQIIDILIRRRQNNPILTGEAGVGKTAIVEGFALRVVSGDVPPVLRNVAIHTLDLGLLQAGASMKGEFESRLRGVVDAIKASSRPIILFIDEAHTLIGAGGAAGQNDAANLLKPALARGELRTIAATTWAEYKKYFEKDAALTRRFQVLNVEQPTEPVAVAMLQALVATLENYHNVRILDEAVQAAVQLSARYIPERQLPDKAVSLLDTACSRVAVSQTTIPGPIDDSRRRIEQINTQLRILDREAVVGSENNDRRTQLRSEHKMLSGELDVLTQRWEGELELVERIESLRNRLEGTASCEDADLLRRAFGDATAELQELQGEQPLIFPLVDAQAVAQVVQNWTGIPAGRMENGQIMSVLTLETAMEKRVIGQSHAIATVTETIRTARAHLADPRKPLGVFLMVGPSGVGKTETALTIAELLYGGEQNLTSINMTEFKEEHKVSLLMGSPPGYVGYGEGGVLTEAVRRRPYSVILLDEIEKAHPGVQDVFFQVFDKGQMRDGEGRDVDFRNTIIIMTSNVAANLIDQLSADPDTMPDSNALSAALRPELTKFFKDAFLGRVTLVPYLPLSHSTIRSVVELQLDRIRKRVSHCYGATFDYDPVLVKTIASRCTETASGARNVESILSRTLLPDMSSHVLEALVDDKRIARIHVGIDINGDFTYSIT